MQFLRKHDNSWTKERKGKWTCIVPIVSISTTKRSDVDHTVTCKYTTSAYADEYSA